MGIYRNLRETRVVRMGFRGSRVQIPPSRLRKVNHANDFRWQDLLFPETRLPFLLPFLPGDQAPRSFCVSLITASRVALSGAW